MLEPGAARSTDVAPKLLKLARLSLLSDAATEMMLGDVKLDGIERARRRCSCCCCRRRRRSGCRRCRPRRSPHSARDAGRVRSSPSCCCSRGCSRRGSSTRRCSRSRRSAPASVPLPCCSMNLHARIFAFQLTPATPEAVVADAGDGAGGVRAVAVVVHRVPAVGSFASIVDAVDVVDVAVVVVVDAVAGNLAGVAPHVRGEVGVVVVHAGVDVGDDDRRMRRW